jgi:HEAT repeats
MGLFDIFKGKGGGGSGGANGEKKKPNAAAKWAEAAASKRAQAYDRQEAIQELCKLKSADGVEALLKRFTFATDPSITDQEEKDAVFEGIVSAGREAIEPVRAFAAKADSVAQPLRIMKEILEEEELIDELLVWLERWDTEYAKFIDPKLQILQALEEYRNPKIREAIEPFLQDVNEPARFAAAAATLAQKDVEAIPPLLAAFLEEESVRVKGKIADGFISLKWAIPDESRDAIRKALPTQYSVDGEGQMTKRAGGY